jgi:hypothetical protein
VGARMTGVELAVGVPFAVALLGYCMTRWSR